VPVAKLAIYWSEYNKGSNELVKMQIGLSFKSGALLSMFIHGEIVGFTMAD